MGRFPAVLVFIGVVVLVYGGANFYIGYRGWQVAKNIQWLHSRTYWMAFWLLACSYIAARLLGSYLPPEVDRAFTMVGAYWLGAMYYLFLILVVIDLFRFANRWLNVVPDQIKNHPLIFGGAIVILVVGLLTYGTWNAQHPKVTHYNITIPKNGGQLKELHMVAVSDIHLGTIINNGRLAKLVKMINQQKPDIVVLPGDIVDENIEPFAEQNMAATFSEIKAPLGVYACMGNHEYIGNAGQELLHYFAEGRIKLLRDRWELVDKSFYLVGRENTQHGIGTREPLTKVLNQADKSYPIIVLDHQPSDLSEPAGQGVDLQVSGHTHVGQMFPNNFITAKMFEQDRGYLRKGAFQLIVSSGYGTWGPPIRIGNHPEIVDIHISFSDPKQQ